jgi:proteasome beta subunit
MTFDHEYWGSSFIGLLKTRHPDLLPRMETPAHGVSLVHGTTICALTFSGGVLLGGDRRATIDGHIVMHEEVTKVFKVDEFSAVAIAGTFGPSIKMVRLFQTELEHYEKIEGLPLSLDGKANKLSLMMETNFPAAMQGLIVMPLFAGFDTVDKVGKIYEYDVTGGIFSRAKQEPYATSGSGGERARTTFEHFWVADLDRDRAIALMEKALLFAAKRDTATGVVGHIIMAVTADGVESVRGGEEA